MIACIVTGTSRQTLQKYKIFSNYDFFCVNSHCDTAVRPAIATFSYQNISPPQWKTKQSK